SLGVNLSHATHMAREMTLSDEVAEYRLIEERCVAARDRQRRGDDVHEIRWQDEIAQAERREQHFAEAAGEQHDVVRVESLQCRHWPPRVAILAVVVVLEDHRTRTARPVEQRQPPAE